MSKDANSGVSFAEQHVALAATRGLSLATSDDETFNTIRVRLAPVACWRLNRTGFAFDSSFVAPAFRGEILKLQGVVARNPECPAALFGHCDPAGSDELNKTLSDRRAIAIYALLTRQPALWADLYDNPQVGDTWGTVALQTILASIVDKQGAVYYLGAIDGDYGSGTTAAVKRFQPSAGLPGTGKADAATRKALFAVYMDWLCTPAADAGTPAAAPFQMKTSDFLGNGAPGALPKMSLQGCSEFNAVVSLSASEMKGDKAQRDADDAPNRRAVMFFFAKGTTVTAASWPCPKVKEPLGGCKKAFWPDGEKRRKNGEALREYKETHDTMACRFYDRFARRSPCEGGRPITFRFALPVGEHGWPESATVSLVQDGDTVWTSRIADGRLQGEYRAFAVPVAAGPPIRGHVSIGETDIGLFGDSALYDIAVGAPDAPLMPSTDAVDGTEEEA